MAEPIANITTTSSLADSLPTIIASARIEREYEGVMTSGNVVDLIELDANTGLIWNEVALQPLCALRVEQTTVLDNPQRITDTIFQVEPTMIGISTVIPDKAMRSISGNVAAQVGQLGQNAIQRLKNQDGHTLLDGAATALGGGACSVLNTGEVVAAGVRVKGGGCEPGPDPVHVVLHSFQLHDIWSDIVNIDCNVGTACATAISLQSDYSDKVFQQGISAIGMIGGFKVFRCDLISTACCQAKGGVFSQRGVVLVQGMAPRVAVTRREDVGGGSEVVFHYDDYAYGERASGSGPWLFEIHSDATAPAG